MGEQLGEILTIAQLAERVKWSKQRMYRYLRGVDEQLGGVLLVNIGRPGRRPTWTVALEAMCRVNPQWCVTLEGMPGRLARLEERVDELEEVRRAQNREIGRLNLELANIRRRIAVGRAA